MAFPVVLRFTCVMPNDTKGTQRHADRNGVDMSHIDMDRKKDTVWFEGEHEKLNIVVNQRIKEISEQNLANELEALDKLHRQKAKDERKKRGEQPPFRMTKTGPLREAVLTAGQEYFLADEDERDVYISHKTNEFGERVPVRLSKAKIAVFENKGKAFFDTYFPDQVIHKRLDMDEETPHFHVVLFIKKETVSERRGKQVMLQPSANPLIASYEHAQDIAGTFFQDIGLERGECRAAARREAKDRDEVPPEKKKHVTPRQHRAQRAEDLRKREDVVSAKEGLLAGLSDGVIDARPDGGGSSIAFADKGDDARKSFIEEKINRAKPAAMMLKRLFTSAMTKVVDAAKAKADEIIAQAEDMARRITAVAEDTLARAEAKEKAIDAAARQLEQDRNQLEQKERDLAHREDTVSAKEGVLIGMRDGMIIVRSQNDGSAIEFSKDIDETQKQALEEQINRDKPAAISTNKRYVCSVKRYAKKAAKEAQDVRNLAEKDAQAIKASAEKILSAAKLQEKQLGLRWEKLLQHSKEHDQQMRGIHRRKAKLEQEALDIKVTECSVRAKAAAFEGLTNNILKHNPGRPQDKFKARLFANRKRREYLLNEIRLDPSAADEIAEFFNSYEARRDNALSEALDQRERAAREKQEASEEKQRLQQETVDLQKQRRSAKDAEERANEKSHLAWKLGEELRTKLKIADQVFRIAKRFVPQHERSQFSAEVQEKVEGSEKLLKSVDQRTRGRER